MSDISRRTFLKGASIAGIATAGGLTLTGCGTSSGAASSGTGSATVRGFGGDVTVDLTVSDASITKCAIDGPDETPERGGRAIQIMQQGYMDGGTLEVDAVAGATVTSTAVASAASQAYSQATGKKLNADVMMKPGSYTASSVGFWGIWDVPVTITVNETSILSIEAPEARDMQGETEGFFNPVKEHLFPRIIKYQSTSVDSIVGCTASSNAVKTAVDKALTEALEAGGSEASALDAFHAVPVKEANDETEEIDCDILVVGLATCGLLSMKAALESLMTYSNRAERIKIVGIDKCGKFGGQSFMTHSPNCVNPPKRLAEEDDPKALYVDPAVMRADWIAHVTGADGNVKAKESCIDLFLNESGNTLDWLIYDCGFMMAKPNATKEDFTDSDFPQKTCWCYYGNYTSDTFYESNEDRRAVMMSYYDKIIEEIKGAGGSYMLETEGYELLYDEATNTITGAKARNLYTGQEYVINAGAVIMSTGGYLSNPDLCNKLLPENLRGIWKQNGNTQNDGKMVQAALDVGAATFNADLSPICMEIALPHYLEHFPINDVEGKITARTGRTSTWTFNDIPLYMCVSINSLAVGPDGNRICNEYGIANGIEDRCPPDTWVVGPYFYSIWSQQQVDELVSEGFSSDNVIRTAAYCQRGGFKLDEPRPETQEALDACIDDELAWKADSLEELADLINMSADDLVATVDRYNGFCAAGADDDFGKAAQYLTALGSGPYYAIKAMNVPYGSGGCFDVDTHMNALKDDHETPINGLYIGGQDSFGVTQSPEKNYITYGGVDQGWHILSGRTMGLSAAEYVYNNYGLLSEREEQ